MSEEKAEYNPSDGMMNLKGKAYLPVAARIVWFRNDYPEGTIETIIREIDHERGFAMFTAEVCTGQGGRATATGSETVKDFGDYIEKAETKAVGRALGYLGYGTAAAGFEEGKRIVDAPQDFRQSAAKPAPTPRQMPQEPRHAPLGTPTPAEFVVARTGNTNAPDLDANLLARIKDDQASPEMRNRALHNYYNRAETLADLKRRELLVEKSGIPESDRTKALAWHVNRLAPASVAG